MNLELTDKIPFVTGASSGIGAAVARILAEESADVVIAFGHRRFPSGELGRDEAGSAALCDRGRDRPLHRLCRQPHHGFHDRRHDRH